jgi:hypothetical protein
MAAEWQPRLVIHLDATTTLNMFMLDKSVVNKITKYRAIIPFVAARWTYMVLLPTLNGMDMKNMGIFTMTSITIWTTATNLRARDASILEGDTAWVFAG